MDDKFKIEQFQELGYQVVDLLAQYYEDCKSRSIPVLPWQEPDQAIESWATEFGLEPDKDLINVFKNFIQESNHLHHPHYAGHQVAPGLPLAALAELVYAALNNGSTVYEMGPAGFALEKHIIKWMAGLLGYDDSADGILTSGASLGNLTALLAARQIKAGYDTWQEGIKAEAGLSVMVSAERHYSITRALKILGLGEQGIVTVPVDDQYRLDHNCLEDIYKEAISQGRRIFALAAGSCSTVTGAYDNLEPIADFCQEHDIWLHVDGAHGASVALSDKYRHLIKGIDRADSVVWDAHKMMLIPSLITAVIFKNGDDSYKTFSQQSSLLFGNEDNQEYYNLCNRTLECTKPVMALKLYFALKAHGIQYFADYIDYTHQLAQDFASMLEQTDDFELLIKPESNIVCFRFTPGGMDESKLNALQGSIRQELIKSGKFYIVQTDIGDKVYLRVCLINPLTKVEDLRELLEFIRHADKSNYISENLEPSLANNPG